MGDGGKTIGGGNQYQPTAQQITPNGTHIECFRVPNGKKITGAVYSDTVKQTQPQAQPDAQLQNCKPCQSWGAKIGNGLGKVFRTIKGVVSSIWNGFSGLLCFTGVAAAGAVIGVTNAFGRFGATLASYKPTICQPMSFNYTPMTYSCMPTFTSFNTGGSFTTGLLMGSLLSNHRHCHSHISRPIIINRIGGGFHHHRTFCRPCGWV